MALIINTNVASINAQRNLSINQSALSQSLARLSSGLRINSAADDPAGLSIATKFGAQVNGLNQAVRNANNATALVQTAAGGASTLINMLQTLRTLAVQSSSDDNTSSDRANLAQEASNLQTEITRIASTTQYNTMNLLDGTFSGKYFQVGANFGQTITFNIGNAQANALGGRAEFKANIANGVINSQNENIGSTSAVKVNGSGTATTSASSDTYSVLDLSSGVVAGITGAKLASLAGLSLAASVMQSGGSVVLSLGFTVNGVSIHLNYSFTAESIAIMGGVVDSASYTMAAFTSVVVTGASLAQDIVSAIQNNASLAALNITARTANGGSAWVIEATKGTDVTATLSLAAVASTLVRNLASTEVSLVGAAALMSGVASVIGDGAVALSATTAYNGQSSAIAKAVAINAIQNTTAVTATAEPNVLTMATGVLASTINQGDVYINGNDLGNVVVSSGDSAGTLVTAINNISANTGVTASMSGSKLVLTAADGRNIAITTNTTAIATNLGLNTADAVGTSYVYRGQVQLNSNTSFTLSGNLYSLYGTGTADNMTETSATSNSVVSGTSTYNIGAVDISTQGNAEAAILTIDAALNQLNTINANIGAVQNRLGFTIANLQTGSQNMAAAQSTIMDADFAAETASFQKNQILVQAGTAMIAQANTLPQIALQLLK